MEILGNMKSVDDLDNLIEAWPNDEPIMDDTKNFSSMNQEFGRFERVTFDFAGADNGFHDEYMYDF